MFRMQVKIVCFFTLCVIVSACASPEIQEQTGKEEQRVSLKEKQESAQKTKQKNPLEQEITPRTWNLWELDEQFRKAGLKIGMLRKKSLIIPSELRFIKVRIETLLLKTAKFNGELKLWFSGDKTDRVLFYREVDPKELAQVKKDWLSKDINIRIEATWKVGWLAHPDLILPLSKISESKDKDLSLQALLSLKRIGLNSSSICIAEKSLAFLSVAIERKEFSTGLSAAHALQNVVKEDIFFLVEKLFEEKKYIRHRVALKSLGNLGDDKSFARLKFFLQNKNIDLRSSSISAIGNNYKKKGFALLTKSLEDENRRVRNSSINALENIGGEKALGLIIGTLNDKDGYIRSTAVAALGRMGGKETLVHIEKALDDKSIYVRSAALRAMGIIDKQKAFFTIEKILKNKDPDIRCYVLQAIGKIGGTEMHDLLDDGLLDDVASVRESALDAFENYKDKKTKAILQNHLSRETEKKLRIKTANLLKQMDN